MRRITFSVLFLFALLSSAFAQSGCPDSGLVAFWTFDGGSLTDIIGGHDGTNHGAAVCNDRCGRADSAFYFNGVDNYMTVDNDSVFYTMPALTISLWMKMNEFGDPYTELFLKETSFQMNVRSFGVAEFGISNHSGLEWEGILSDTLTTGIWYFLTGTFDTTTKEMKFYINGELVGTHIHSTWDSWQPGEDIYIGRNGPIFDMGYTNGSIDNIHFYNRALSDSEVLALYECERCEEEDWCLDWSAADSILPQDAGWELSNPGGVSPTSWTDSSLVLDMMTHGYPYGWGATPCFWAGDTNKIEWSVMVDNYTGDGRPGVSVVAVNSDSIRFEIGFKDSVLVYYDSLGTRHDIPFNTHTFNDYELVFYEDSFWFYCEDTLVLSGQGFIYPGGLPGIIYTFYWGDPTYSARSNSEWKYIRSTCSAPSHCDTIDWCLDWSAADTILPQDAGWEGSYLDEIDTMYWTDSSLVIDLTIDPWDDRYMWRDTTLCIWADDTNIIEWSVMVNEYEPHGSSHPAFNIAVVNSDNIEFNIGFKDSVISWIESYYVPYDSAFNTHIFRDYALVIYEDTYWLYCDGALLHSGHGFTPFYFTPNTIGMGDNTPTHGDARVELAYIRATCSAPSHCDTTITCTPSIDSVWFSEETECNDSNIVEICYTLSSDCPESTYTISAQMSADSGETWDVPFVTLLDAEGNIGDSVAVGTHCFEWVMSEDTIIEGNDFFVEIDAYSYELETYEIIDSFEISGLSNPSGITFKGGYLIIGEHGGNTIYWIDTTTYTEYRNIHTPCGHMEDFSFIDNDLYIIGAFGSSWKICRIDTLSGDTLNCSELSIDMNGLTYYGDYIIATGYPMQRLYLFDRSDLSFIDSCDIDIGGSWIEGLTNYRGFLWAVRDGATDVEGTIFQIDIIEPESCYFEILDSFQAPTHTSHLAEGLTNDGHNLWYVNGKIYKIALYENEVFSSAFSPLDSRAPRIDAATEPVKNYPMSDQSIYIYSIEDLFCDYEAGDTVDMADGFIIIDACGLQDTFQIYGDTMSFFLPYIECDTGWVIVAVRDSFCNWTYDSLFFEVENVAPIMRGCIDSLFVITIGDTLAYGLSVADEGGIDSVHFDVTIDADTGYSEISVDTFIWVPADTGAVDITILATDVLGAQDTCEFTAYVLCSDSTPYFTACPPDTELSVGDTLTFTLDAEDPDGGLLSYDFVGDSYGATIDSDGVLHWIIPDTLVYDMAIEVRDYCHADTCEFTISPTGIMENYAKPDKVSLDIIPNPFNASCKITVESAAGGEVKIYDIMGVQVASYNVRAGQSEFIWNGGNKMSGIYFVRLKAGDRTITKRAILMK